MPDTPGIRRLFTALVVAVGIAAIGCDEQPEIVSSNVTASAGAMEFDYDGHHLRYLELTDDDGATLEYPEPVLAIDVTVTNVGEDEFVYTPRHDARDKDQAEHPMLYDAPATAEIDWAEFSPQPVTDGARLRQGHWEQQQLDSVSLAPGEELTDTYLFEVPEADEQTLMLSLPPLFHRGEVPVFIEFDYRRSEPEGRTMYEVGDDIAFDDVIFTVTDITQEYLPLEDSSEGEGFSDEPVLKIAYTLSNESDDPVEFAPAHNDLTGSEGAMIQAGDVAFARARFPAAVDPVGQLDSVDIEPGESVDDFATFERPDDDADPVTFVLPARYFDRSGTVRVVFSYERQDVEEPEELQQD